MALLEALQLFLMVLDRGLQLFDIFGPSFSEGRLGLTVPLLSFL